MLESGGGYGGTSWVGRSVPDMWQAIGNQETTGHWELLTGWRRSSELTHQHLAAVQRYRAGLAAAWPPERSPAAAAYVAQLDALIANLHQTYDAAVANYTAFSGATLALTSARRDLEKVVTEYVANEGKLAAFEQEKADRPLAGNKAVPPPLRSPVAEGRQAELEARARSIMYGLSSEIMQARAQVVKPAKFEPGNHASNGEYARDGDVYSAPPIPAVVPFDPTSDASVPPRQHAEVGPPAGVQPSPSSSDLARQPGLVLGGIHPPSTSPQTTVAVPVTTTDAVPAPSTAPPLTAPPPRSSSAPRASQRSNARTPSPPGSPPVVGPGRSSPLGRPTAVSPSSQRVMPPGGVIGATPGTALVPPAQSNRTPTVNPVGGALGQSAQQSGRSPVPHASAPFGQPLLPAGQRGGNERDESAGIIRRNPENPWETATGVPPVVSPPPMQRVDPGPAIGLP